MDNKIAANILNRLLEEDYGLVSSILDTRFPVSNPDADLGAFVHSGKDMTALSLLSGIVGGLRVVHENNRIKSFEAFDQAVPANWIPLQAQAFIERRRAERLNQQAARLSSVGTVYCPREYLRQRRWCTADLDLDAGILRISFLGKRTHRPNEFKILYSGNISLGKVLASKILEEAVKNGYESYQHTIQTYVALRIIRYDERMDALEISIRP